MQANCLGFEIEPGVYSGCDRTKGHDCPICSGTGNMEFCPRCGDCVDFTTTGDIVCPHCGWAFEKMDSTEELMELLSRPNSNAADIIEQTLHDRGLDILFDIEPLPDDFRLLEPGTNLWSRFWKAHPEKQGAMLEWKELLEGGLFSYA